jgi:hypothetical protein
MEIVVEEISETIFKVTVMDRTTTTHLVTVTAEYCQKLTGGEVPAKRLVKKSFEFLLDHEPNINILRAFDLPMIQRYFPAFETKIQDRLK